MRKYNDLFIQCFSTFYVVFKLSNNLSSPFLGPILFVSLKQIEVITDTRIIPLSQIVTFL